MKDWKNRERIVNLHRIIFVLSASVFCFVLILLKIASDSSKGAQTEVHEALGKCCEQVSYAEKLIDPVALFTLALVVSTALLWRSTERLAALAARQARDNAESLRIAAANAQTSQDALALSRNVADRDIRPWLSIMSVALGGPVAFEQANSGRILRVIVNFAVRNVGKSAAKNVRATVECDNPRIRQEWIDALVSSEVRRNNNDLGSVLVSGEEFPVTFHSGVTGDAVDRTIDFQSTHFVSPVVSIVVSYRNVVGDQSVYYTVKTLCVVELIDGMTMMINVNHLPLQPPNVALAGIPEGSRAI